MHQRGWIAIAVLIVAVGGGAWALKRAGAGVPAAPVEPPPLVFSPQEAAPAALRELPRLITFSGPLVAPNTATVRAKTAGTLLTLAVSEGSRVRQGQVLGELDLAELRARLNERTALVESARAQWAQAERSHASNQHLAEQQFISPNALENSRAARESARAQLEAARAQADSVRIALREAALQAPISGIVAKRQVLPGEKVAAEQALLTLVDLRRLEMAGSVGTHEVGALRPGMPVSLRVEGEERPVTGRLARIAPAVEAGSRSIGVAVEIDNPDEHLRAGQYAQAEVRLPGQAPVLTVPQLALSSASGQDYVWAIEQGKLVRRSVTVGIRDPEHGLVEVLQGVSAGTVVLARRFENLREGAAAKVGDPTAATAASAPAPAASH